MTFAAAAPTAGSVRPDTDEATMPPLTVVVTPVYNGDAFLAAAMESVQAQTYGNLLHIVLDNASTDGTPDILEAYREARIPVVIYRNEATLPLTDNWDKAFSFIPREAVYAKLLCADDLMHPDCVRRFVELAEANPTIQTVSCHDVHHDLIRRANIPEGCAIVDGRVASAAILDRSISWLPFQHLFVRLTAEDHEAPFFGTHDFGADPHAVVRAALRGDLGYIHEPLVYSRRHAGAASNSLALHGRSPLFARQVNMMLLTYFKMMLRFGDRCWPEKQRTRAIRFARAQLLRTELQWRLRRFDFARQELRLELQALGCSLRVTDYLAALSGFPAYVLWKLRWRTKIGPKFSETDFLSS